MTKNGKQQDCKNTRSASRGETRNNKVMSGSSENTSEVGAEDAFFHQEKSSLGKEVLNVTQEYSGDETESLAKSERDLYPRRVNNMRMQFAWGAIILAFSWIFAILLVTLSHGVGALYVYPFVCIVCGLVGAIVSATVVYCIFMFLYACAQHRGTQTYNRFRWALFWREAASPAAFASASVLGVVAFFGSACILEGCEPIPFVHLSDSVIVALITSTTVSVLGILGAVMWWLFPRKESK